MALSGRPGLDLVMPVEFLSDDQALAFGRFSGVPSRRELEQSAWFDDADRAVIVGHRGDGNRLGFATQLATVRMVGGFLVDPLDVPWAVVTFVAGQLGIADPSVVKSYAAREDAVRASVGDRRTFWLPALG